MSGLNLADVHEAIAAAIPDREAFVWRDRRLTYRDLDERTNRLAAFLHAQGLGCHTDRSALEPWESGQDHLAIYLFNGNEYIESMVGSFKARVAPFNVNYRYTDDELVALLVDANARAVVFHAEFAPNMARVRHRLPNLAVFVQVPDDSGEPLLAGAVSYESIVDNGPAPALDLERSPDDLYLICTGGTTGAPKAVLWRQADIFAAVLAAQRDEASVNDINRVVDFAVGGAPRYLPASPFMHGSAQWFAFVALHSGGVCVLPDDAARFDATDVLNVVEREAVNGMSIVGDVFARPLLEDLRTTKRQLDSFRLIASGGAVLSASVKAELIDTLPGVIVVDTLGSSETGAQGQTITMGALPAQTGAFPLTADTLVLDEDRQRVLPSTDPTPGWLARVGAVPLGYLGDKAKTLATFPVVEGQRCSVPGDKVFHRGDGTLGFVGRDSVTINSGGEKIFAEEVEAALKTHDDVLDAIVVGRPSEKWGSEVVALVQVVANASPTADALTDHCATQLARYKLPKQVVFLPSIERTPAGKPDYRWAREQAMSSGAGEA